MILDANAPLAISQAVDVLRHGDLVAMPTETVYGLAADASQAQAVAKIFSLKARPQTNPLIVHLAEVSQLRHWAVHIPAVAYRLAEAFWPGPMTLILPKAPWVADIITAKQATIALRIPSHLVAQALLKAFGGGLAAPSANRFTQISPTTALHVEAALGKDLFILDGGPATVGIESTIIDCCAEQIAVLRPGMLAAESLSEVVGYAVTYQEAKEIQRPGQHRLHYAPQAECVLLSTEELMAESGRMDTGYIVYSQELVLSLDRSHRVQLSAQPDAYARDLYAAMHTLDRRFLRIAIELPPAMPAWYAVHERLAKAAAGR